MADRFYSLAQGEHRVDQVTEGASTSSEAVELRVADTDYADPLDVILRLETLVRYLKTKETRPIA